MESSNPCYRIPALLLNHCLSRLGACRFTYSKLVKELYWFLEEGKLNYLTVESKSREKVINAVNPQIARCPSFMQHELKNNKKFLGFAGYVIF